MGTTNYLTDDLILGNTLLESPSGWNIASIHKIKLENYKDVKDFTFMDWHCSLNCLAFCQDL